VTLFYELGWELEKDRSDQFVRQTGRDGTMDRAA